MLCLKVQLLKYEQLYMWEALTTSWHLSISAVHDEFIILAKVDQKSWQNTVCTEPFDPFKSVSQGLSMIVVSLPSSQFCKKSWKQPWKHWLFLNSPSTHKTWCKIYNPFNKNQGCLSHCSSLPLTGSSKTTQIQSINFATIIHLLFYNIKSIWSQVLHNSRVPHSNEFVSSTWTVYWQPAQTCGAKVTSLF